MSSPVAVGDETPRPSYGKSLDNSHRRLRVAGGERLGYR